MAATQSSWSESKTPRPNTTSLDLARFKTMELYLKYKKLLNANDFDAKYFPVVVVVFCVVALIERLLEKYFKNPTS